MRIALLGIPTNSSGMTDGVARAPRALRDADLVARLQAVAPLVDLGDLQLGRPEPIRAPSGILDAANLASTLSMARAATASARVEDDWPMLIGGDCPILIGALAGHAETTGDVPGLLFVDGHEDAWPPAASTTSEAADMELGLLLGRWIDGLEPDLRAEIPLLRPSDVVLLGARDRAEIIQAGVASLANAVTIHDDRAVRADPAAVAADAVPRFADADRDWWLHVDLDVLSTDALPAVDYPQDGGLSWSELSDLATSALSSGGCVGATVTIYNPDLDPDRRHAREIVDFLVQLASYATARGR